jgi:prepilin signal peptidase PulO-like enzyme (type II secretory pathway)
MALLVAGCGIGGVALGALLDWLVTGPVMAATPIGDHSGELTRVPADAHNASQVAGDVRVGGDARMIADGSGQRQSVALDATETGAGPRYEARRPGTRAVVAGLVTGALCAGSAQHFGAVGPLAAYSVLFAGLVVLSVVDLRQGLVPRVVLYTLAALVGVALVGSATAGGQWHEVLDAAIGGAAAFGAFFAVWWFNPRGIGFGDVRLAGLLGIGLGWLGFFHLYVGVVIGLLVGTVFGITLMLARGTGRKTRMPLVPSLSAGAFVAVIWGTQIINAWFPGHR